MMTRIQFVKPTFLFQSGDEATVPDRVARHLAGAGFAYVKRDKPAAPPAKAPRRKKP